MMEIDGSYGEGGGQILRTAIALSLITNQPVTVTRIRACRPNPGLRAQHVTAIRTLQSISNAEVDGVSVGSPQVSFHPGVIKGGSYIFDVGTAGSITLVFQTLLLASLAASQPLQLHVRGGTDVKWSPSWDYFANVFLPLVSHIGVKAEVNLNRRGFYPAGGGEAFITIHPVKKFLPFQVEGFQTYRTVEGNIAISKLPSHVSGRIKHAVVKFFLSHSTDVKISVERDDKSLSEGVVVTLWSHSGETVVGSTMLGEKGFPAESLGKQCAAALSQEMKAQVSLDVHATDQLLPYMAFVAAQHGKPSAFLTREISSHARTTMWLMEKFLPVKFKVERVKNYEKVMVRSI
ncbi:MAG TPA: RNA 3'-terminal phosphate cyclase [Thermoplasmata archaeon]|nr:RNA 3'-terminal phosphate cyclase [Thermoplasmata archaeon]